MAYRLPPAYRFYPSGPNNTNLYHLKSGSDWALVIARLTSEKEVLESGLANCVAYLDALRKKRDRNTRRLSADSSMARRKRKKIRQNNYQLECDIKNRELAERAFLNNLNACKTNIYLAQIRLHSSLKPWPAMYSYHASGPSVKLPYYESQPSYPSLASKSKPSRRCWNGWADNFIGVPYPLGFRNPLTRHETGPNHCFTGFIGCEATFNGEMEQDCDMAQHTPDYETELCVSADAAQSWFPYLAMEHKATFSETCMANKNYDDASLGRDFDRLSLSSLTTDKLEPVNLQESSNVSASYTTRCCSSPFVSNIDEDKRNLWHETAADRGFDQESTSVGTRKHRAVSI